MESEPDEESHDGSQNVSVIRVHFDESYEGLSVSSQAENSGAVKGKYYKQTYRTAWESMPDFKGWLRGVQGEPTRAYCLYCQKTLHAHRLSLLKHTCTIRHQKAAQIHNIRKDKEQMSHSQDIIMTSSVPVNDTDSHAEEGEAIVEYRDVDDGKHEEDDHDLELDDVEEEEDSIALESLPVQFQKQFRQQIVNPMSSTKPPISTHVLDTSKGVPVAGLQVSLYKLIEGRWTYINEGLTNPDGRFTNFLERSDFTPGRYKLHYDVDRFFEARKQDTLYPFIEVRRVVRSRLTLIVVVLQIVFDCRTPNDHYHVPLLLSPFGYTTYRGS